MAKGKGKSTGVEWPIKCGPCSKCGAFTPLSGGHDCQKVLREKAKAAIEESKKQAKHSSTNDKKKKQAPPSPPPPPPPPAGTTTASAPPPRG